MSPFLKSSDLKEETEALSPESGIKTSNYGKPKEFKKNTRRAQEQTT